MESCEISRLTKLKSSAKCISLLSENKLTFDKKTVANILNTFFTTVAASLVGKLPNITGGYQVMLEILSINITKIKVLNKTLLNFLLSERKTF